MELLTVSFTSSPWFSVSTTLILFYCAIPPANSLQTENIFSSCEVFVDSRILQLFKVGGKSFPKLSECVLLLQYSTFIP